ncbi:MAG TPA: NUDIX hydrolase [Dehalococcoidia bacterium]|nr:NUDIX hydrolase [Dehalococcoidia bacterium]
MSKEPESNSKWYPQHPRVAVHALILHEDCMLLIKRATEPSKGKWSLPGGRIELGETIYQAIKREVLEECSAEIEMECIFDVGDTIIRDEEERVSYHFVLIYFLARYKGGEVKARTDAEDARWFTTEELDEADMHPLLRDVLTKATRSMKNG